MNHHDHAVDAPYRGMLAIQVSAPERLAFLRKVYSLFGLALLIFTASAYVGVQTSLGLTVFAPILKMGFLGMILLMVFPMLLLRVTAARYPINLVGLGVFAVFEGLFTSVLLQSVLWGHGNGGQIILQAGVLTVTIFGGLTLYTLTSKTDFSFLRGALYIGLFALIGIVLLSALFGFQYSQFGMSLAFVVLMAGFVLYDTSNIMRHYRTDMAVNAAAMLFWDFVILFWHLVSLLSSSDD